MQNTPFENTILVKHNLSNNFYTLRTCFSLTTNLAAATAATAATAAAAEEEEELQ